MKKKLHPTIAEIPPPTGGDIWPRFGKKVIFAGYYGRNEKTSSALVVSHYLYVRRFTAVVLLGTFWSGWCGFPHMPLCLFHIFCFRVVLLQEKIWTKQFYPTRRGGNIFKSLDNIKQHFPDHLVGFAHTTYSSQVMREGTQYFSISIDDNAGPTHLLRSILASETHPLRN